jgi:hypothetical protein
MEYLITLLLVFIAFQLGRRQGREEAYEKFLYKPAADRDDKKQEET